MQIVNLNELDLTPVASELDPERRPQVTFPHSSAVGNASTGTVYFELAPGDHVGMHRDSSEELLLVLEGEAEAIVGDEQARASAGTIVTVPAMDPHDVRNIGQGTLRILGFFSAPTVVATFEEPLATDGPQVFVIGAPIQIAVPLQEAVSVQATVPA